MALLKTSFWFVPTVLIPVVCGQPCEFSRQGRLDSGFVRNDTGFFVDTAVVPIENNVTIQSIQAVCDIMSQTWTVLVEVSGDVSFATVEPKYNDEMIVVLDESHEMVWESADDWALFSLVLSISTTSEYEPGMTTRIPCHESSDLYTVWVVQVLGLEGALGDCRIYGDQASVYEANFPECGVW